MNDSMSNRTGQLRRISISPQGAFFCVDFTKFPKRLLTLRKFTFYQCIFKINIFIEKQII